MADQRITDLTNYSSPSSASDVLPIVDVTANSTKKITLTNFLSYIGSFVQTLTNKTIVAANNTITTAASGSLAATELNAALAELSGDTDTVAADLASHEASTAEHGATGAVVGTTNTQTLTNKRVTRRLATTNAPGATPTTNTDNVDIMNFTGLATAITSMTTNLSGTPVDGDKIEFRFTDNGTARAITWGASFGATTIPLPTTTVISTMLRVGFEWNGSLWQCIAVA